MRTFGASFVYLMMSGITSLSYSMLLTVELVYFTRTVGFDPLQLVLIGTLRQAICFVFQAPTGVLADMYSRRWAVILGLLLVGSGYLVEGSLPVLAVVFAAQGLWGLGTTLMDGADAAWIADEMGVERPGRSTCVPRRLAPCPRSWGLRSVLAWSMSVSTCPSWWVGVFSSP